jgi:hypothetical protein
MIAMATSQRFIPVTARPRLAIFYQRFFLVGNGLRPRRGLLMDALLRGALFSIWLLTGVWLFHCPLLLRFTFDQRRTRARMTSFRRAARPV